LDKKGNKLRNNLLGQTITFALNLRLPYNPYDSTFIISTAEICTQEAELIDGVFYPAEGSSCDCFQTIPASVVAAIAQLQIAHPSWTDAEALLELANLVLAGQDTFGASMSDIHAALGILNEAYDECRTECAKD
jgi:hypothetical protein